MASSATAQSLPIEEALQLLFEDTNLEERISLITDRASNSIESATYVVQAGDTLGGIVNMLYGNSSILREKQFSSPSDQKSSRFRTGKSQPFTGWFYYRKIRTRRSPQPHFQQLWRRGQ